VFSVSGEPGSRRSDTLFRINAYYNFLKEEFSYVSGTETKVAGFKGSHTHFKGASLR
jgi:hypothetical protein